MISRAVRSALVLSVALLVLCGCSGVSRGGPETIRHFDIHYTIEDSGIVHVVETIDYNFAGAKEKHSIDRFLASRFSTPVEGQDRVYRYSNITVSSPTGASALFSTSRGNALQIRVGNKNAHVNGKQTYVVSYDVDGAVSNVTCYAGYDGTQEAAAKPRTITSSRRPNAPQPRGPSPALVGQTPQRCSPMRGFSSAACSRLVAQV